MLDSPLKPFCFLLVPAAALVISLSPAAAATPDRVPETPSHQVFIPAVSGGSVAHALVIDGRTNVKAQSHEGVEPALLDAQELYVPTIGTPPQIPAFD